MGKANPPGLGLVQSSNGLIKYGPSLYLIVAMYSSWRSPSILMIFKKTREKIWPTRMFQSTSKQAGKVKAIRSSKAQALWS
ncbi:hypothetical protein TorRG33x02_003050 [Trema orientale]|uniref:Uncharacterized protein n=1 Tax=Trema orientale TaxID=63057 RepID=A0A2P5G1W2_TREOI|nr:hypothetical protein TorRG33x02_003050 [Trema orientale]